MSQHHLMERAQRLYDNGTTANQITVLAAVVSLLVGTVIALFASHTCSGDSAHSTSSPSASASDPAPTAA